MITFDHPNKLKRTVYTFLGERMPLQFLGRYKYYGGLDFLRWKSLLKKSQWFSNEQIREYQTTHLLRLIRHCHEHVPFYRSFFNERGLPRRDIEKPEDLSLLPIITKYMLKRDPTRFLADSYKNYSPVEWQTGGSSGKPLHFYRDRKVNALVGALGWRFERWGGQTVHDRHVMMRSAIGYREGKIDFDTLYKYDPLNRMLEINTVNLNQEHMERVFVLFKEFKPAFLHSYASTANVLAMFVLANPQWKVDLKGVLVGGEYLYPYMRTNIEKAFDCKVFNFYGMEEATTFAMECEEGNMHLSPEMGILEIIKDGKPCKPGKVGEFVCTGLHNYSMPLIRYAMGDYGYFKDIECPCGRKLPVIEIVGGRQKDLLVTHSGVVNVVTLENISKKVKGIDGFQIIQNNLNAIKVRIVKDFDYSEKDRQEIYTGLRRLLGDDVHIDFEFVEHIPRSGAGKFKFVISNVPIEAGSR